MRIFSIEFFASIIAGMSLLALGILSFAALYAILPILPIAIIAFFLGTFIDESNYLQSIIKALQSFSFHFDALHLRRGIVHRYLKMLLELDNIENMFLATYKETLVSSNNNRLKLMESFFLERLMPRPTQSTTTVMERSVDSLISHIHVKHPVLIKQLHAELKQRPILFRLSYIFSLISGMCMGLVAFSAYKTGLLTLGILNVIPGGILITLCIGAAIGYTCIMYQSIADLLMNDHIKIYWKKFINLYSRKPQESIVSWLGKCVSISFAGLTLAGLAIFATAATAGTWWYLAKDGLVALTKLVNIAASWISRTATVMLAIPTFILNVVNPLPTAEKISYSIQNGILRDNWHNLKTNVRKTWNIEVKTCDNVGCIFGLLRFINPFRVLSVALKKLFFIGHLICIGAITGIPNAGNIANTAIGGIQEGLLDEIDDNHGNGWLTHIVNIPIHICKLAAAGWDWMMSGFDSIDNSWNKIYPTKRNHDSTSTKSNPHWQQQEIMLRIEKKIDSLSTIKMIKDTTLTEKQKSLLSILNTLQHISQHPSTHSETTEVFSRLRQQHTNNLNKNRYPFFGSNKNKNRTESLRLLDEAENVFASKK